MSYMELLVRTIVNGTATDTQKVEMLGILLDLQNALLSGSIEVTQRVLSHLGQEVRP